MATWFDSFRKVRVFFGGDPDDPVKAGRGPEQAPPPPRGTEWHKQIVAQEEARKARALAREAAKRDDLEYRRMVHRRSAVIAMKDNPLQPRWSDNDE